MHMAAAALLVGAGGFAGAVARWALGASVQAKALHPHFPVHTFAVNLLGCLAIGLILSWGEVRQFLDERTRLLLITGFLGGFTTFSAFALETLTLGLYEGGREQRARIAALNVRIYELWNRTTLLSLGLVTVATLFLLLAWWRRRATRWR